MHHIVDRSCICCIAQIDLSTLLLAALGLRSHTGVGDDGYKSCMVTRDQKAAFTYPPSFGELTVPYLPLHTTTSAIAANLLTPSLSFIIRRDLVWPGVVPPMQHLTIDR